MSELKYSRFTYRMAVGAFFFLSGNTFSSWAARIPTIKSTYNLNEAELGTVLFMLPLGSLVVLPVSGWAINKYGSRPILLIAAILYGIFLLAIAYSHDILILSSVLFLFGFAGNGFNIAANTQALQVEKRVYGRTLMSSFHALWSAGAMTGAIVTGWMMKNSVTIINQYLMVSGLMFLIFLGASFFLVQGEEKNVGSGKMVWPSKFLWLLGIICFCCALCEGAMADWSALYYKQVVNDGSSVNTTGYTAYAFTMAFGRLIGDRLIDRFGSRQILLIDALFIIAGIAIGIGIVHPMAVIIGFAMIGMGVSTIIPIVYTLSGKNTATPPSVSLATVSSIGFSGFLIGPPLIGYIAHGIGLRMALMLLISMGFIIIILSRRVK
ncbi:MAG: MFS transporter [Flavitalea sp.]